MADFGPVTCAGCALLCDDVTVETSSDGVRLRPECPLGLKWFAERMRPPGQAPATIDGEAANLDSALARAAELLRGARRPLLHGFEGATVEDARAAVALADRLGAVVITGATAGPWPGAPAVALRGASTATLGEIRDRSRLLVIWREDPQSTHPRLLERLGFVGDAERALVVVDDRDTPTARRAAAQLRWTRERDLDALTSLHMLQRGPAPRSGGLEAELQELVERINRVPHLAFVHGPGLTGGAGGQRRALALHELVRALSQKRHAVTLELPGAPGTRSADDVLAWQSGYGGSVDFACGHPKPVTATAPLEDVDVTLRVEPGPAGTLVAGGRGGPEDGPGGSRPEVWIRTAAAGVSAGGTAHRLDGVPLPLHALQPEEAPTAAAVLTALLAGVQR